MFVVEYYIIIIRLRDWCSLWTRTNYEYSNSSKSACLKSPLQY